MFADGFSQDIVTLMLHHLWQGTLLFLAVLLLLKRLSKIDPTTSGWIWAATLWVMAILPFAVLFPKEASAPSTGTAGVTQEINSKPISPSVNAAVQSRGMAAAPAVTTTPVRHSASEVPKASPWSNALAGLPTLLLAVWALGVCWCMARVARGARMLFRLKRVAAPFPENHPLAGWFDAQQKALGLKRRVHLRVSSEITCPMALGLGNPIVILPEHLLSQLQAEDWQRVLLHELAHLRRGDDWANLMQKIIEAVFFYHPGVKLACRRLDLAREKTCDAWAVAILGGSRQYARSLVKMMESMRAYRPMLAVGATSNGKQLSQRVEQLLKPTGPFRSKPALPATLLALGTLSATLISSGLATPRPAWLTFQDERTAQEREEERAALERAALERARQAELLEKAKLRQERQALKEAERRYEQEAKRLQSEEARLEEKYKEAQARLQEKEKRMHERQQAQQEAKQQSNQRQQEAQAREMERANAMAEAQLRELEAHYEEQRAALAAQEEELEKQAQAMRQEMEASEQRFLRAQEAAEVATAEEAQQAEAAWQEAQVAQESISSAYTSGEDVYISNSKNNRIEYTDNHLSLKIAGKVAFNADETAVTKISPKGYFILAENDPESGRHRVEIRADRKGNLSYEYWKNGKKKPFEDEGARWLRENLALLLRNSGINGAERIKSIIEKQGMDAAFEYVEPVTGDYARSLYFRAMMSSPKFRDKDIRNVADATGRMGSDYEKGRIFKALLKRAGDRPDHLDSILKHVNNIDSDYELSQVLKAAVTPASGNAKLLGHMLKAAQNIESDYNKSVFLKHAIRAWPASDLLHHGVLPLALTIDSDYEFTGVATALLNKGGLSQAQVDDILDTTAQSVSSDYEKGRILSLATSEGRVSASFFQAARGVGSDYEKGKVLKQAIRRAAMDEPLLMALLEVVPTMNSDHEKYEVLNAFLNRYDVTDSLQRAYKKALNSLGSDHYHGRLSRKSR